MSGGGPLVKLWSLLMAFLPLPSLPTHAEDEGLWNWVHTHIQGYTWIFRSYRNLQIHVLNIKIYVKYYMLKYLLIVLYILHNPIRYIFIVLHLNLFLSHFSSAVPSWSRWSPQIWAKPAWSASVHSPSSSFFILRSETFILPHEACCHAVTPNDRWLALWKGPSCPIPPASSSSLLQLVNSY